MTVRINKQKINLREKLAEFEDKVNFDEVVRGLGEYTGNVGIGVEDPSHLLHIKSIGAGDFAIEGTQPRIWLKETDQTDLDILMRNHAGQFRIDVTEDNGNLVSTPFLINNTNGDVGIGTTSPGTKLHIQGDSDLNVCIIDAQGTAPNYIFDVRDDGTSKFRVDGAGNVGIGTTNPGYELEVIGDINASVNLRAAGSIITSDDRTKHNEQNIVGAIETLGKLTPKKYIKTTEMYEADHNFELDENGNPVDADGEPVEHTVEAGVIAQQVLTVDELAFMVSPEGVDEDGNVTSPHGLNYNSLFTYAIAAIQEQQSIIEDLKSRIETLESK